MSHFIRRSEIELLHILTNFFKRRGYVCKIHSLLKVGNSFVEFDLVCRSLHSKEVLIIEVKTSEKILDYNIRQYILSKNRFRSQQPQGRHRFYLCIDASTNLTNSARQILESNEIGIIRIRGKSIDSIREPESLDKKINKMFRERVLNINKERLEKQLTTSDYSAILKNLNYRIKEITANLAPSKIKPYKLRISEELIDKLENLSKLGYSDLLKEFGKDYKTIDNANDENRLILKTLGKLWEGKYGKAQGAKAFSSFEKFEPILKDIHGYRDHMVHPFQVFLMGSLIIDENYDFFVSTHKKRFDGAQADSLEFAWLLCSTFHDICYPIQEYEQFSKNFFLEFLQSDVLPIVFQAEKLLVENDNLKYIDQLVALFEHYNKTERDWKFDSSCRIDHKLRSEMINEISNKNHALLSAMALIKKTLEEDFVKADLENYKHGRFSTDIYPASLAIALHDEKMLNKIMGSLSLDEMPLGFLLVYCDLVQESGRTDEADEAELHSFICDAKNIESTLSFTKEQKFEEKTLEMQRIYKKIVSNSIHFQLHLRFSGSTRSEDTFKVTQQK